MTGRIIEPAGKLSPAEREVFDRIHNPVTFDTTAEEVIDSAQAVFPEATVKSRRGPLPVIIVDQQEKTPLTSYFDSKLVRVETAHLATGDYSLKGCTHLVAIERKGLADLQGCVTHDRDRFYDQMRRLRDYPSRFLVVEATKATIEAGAYERDIKPSSITGTLMSLAVRWNIVPVYCKDQKEAAERVQWILLKVAQLQREGFYREYEESLGMVSKEAANGP